MKVLRISGIKLNLDETEEMLAVKAADVLHISADDISSLEIVRKSIDARRHRPPHFVYVLHVSVSASLKLPRISGEEIQVTEASHESPQPFLTSAGRPEFPVVVIGGGPAGLFASYILTCRGIPVILLERGTSIEKRTKDVQKFWEKGLLHPQSNVFFGEGGAGTFSDGKLTSRSGNPYSSWVKNILVEMGAQPEILTDAKPHIGTDRLRQVIVNLRKCLIKKGCRIEFEAQATDFIIREGMMVGVVINGKEEIRTNNMILAIGQSADDTCARLLERGVQLEPKPFAVGLRVEHPQDLINALQYGKWHHHPQLPPAEYFIKASLTDLNRSVYTFCMCPGGSVIACSTFEGNLITNGMSNAARSGAFANSAIVVNVRTDDFSSDGHPLAGLRFRQLWERRAFETGGKNYHAPAQKLTDFLEGRISSTVGPTSFLPGVRSVDLREVLPEFVAHALKRGIKDFDKKMSGFITQDALLIGVETRTSSPVRICRGNDGRSLNIKGLYPCGEGAGYAGGIISSALDGIKAAQNLIENLN